MLMISSSLTIVVVLLTTHMLEDSEFPEPDENGMMPYIFGQNIKFLILQIMQLKVS